MIYERLYRSCVVGDPAENAGTFLRAYKLRMQDVIDNNQWSADEAHAFHSWRTGWMLACLANLPDWSYPAKVGRVIAAERSRRLDKVHARRTHAVVL